MRITHVVRQFWPGIGGLEEVVRRLATEQVAAGHAVRVLTLDRLFTSGERLPPRETLGDIEVVRVPYRGSSKYPVAPGVLLHLGDPDILHVHGVDFLFDFLAWTRPIHRRTLVATTHGGFFHTRDLAALKRLWFATLTRASSRLYGALIACSTSDEALFARLKTGNLTLIENGVAIDKFAGAAATVPRKGLVAIGRFSDNKRFDRLLDAFAALNRRDPDWQFSILGVASDLDAQAVRRLAAERGVQDRVKVVENASDAEVGHELGGASIYVSASEYEGFGLTLVEALAARLLPVVHPNDAFKDFQGRHGGLYLADYAHPEQAADAIERAWRDRVADSEERLRRGQSIAGLYAWPVVSRRYDAVYADAIGRRKTRTALTGESGTSPNPGLDDAPRTR